MFLIVSDFRVRLRFLSSILVATIIAFATPQENIDIVQANTLALSNFSHSAALDLDFEYASPTDFDPLQATTLFERCETVVTKTLSALPASHRETVQLITLTLDDKARRGLGGGSHIIIRCTGMSDAELAAVVIHEVGHTVDATLFAGTSIVTTAFSDGPNVLSIDDQSIAFYTLNWTSNTNHTDDSESSDFVSVYAASDPFEDFAESYAAYVLHGSNFLTAAAKNKTLQAKYDFLKNTVFNGTTYTLAENPIELPVRDITVLPYDFNEFLSF